MPAGPSPRIRSLSPVEPIIRHPVLDAHRISGKTWLGAFPEEAQYTDLLRSPELPFTMVVLCARECQPQQGQRWFPGVQTVTCPFDDSPSGIDDDVWSRITIVVDVVVRQLEAGGRVLITCVAGRNRSALVATRVLARRYPQRSMDDIIAQIRHCRGLVLGYPPLSNPHFVEALMTRSR